MRRSHFVFALSQYHWAGSASRCGTRGASNRRHYGPAYRLLGSIHKQLGDVAGSRSRTGVRPRPAREPGFAAPGGRAARATDELLLHDFFGASRETGKGLLTGGDARLAEFLRADALAYEPPAR